MDTLPSPYYDMLVVNDFMELRDLIYSVGRIKDGIKKGNIVDIKTTTFGKKGNVSNKHVEERSRRNSRQWENLSGTSFTHVLHVPRCPQSDVFRPKCLHGKIVRGPTQAITRQEKGKGLKCTTHFRCPMGNCYPYCHPRKTKKTFISKRIRY